MWGGRAVRPREGRSGRGAGYRDAGGGPRGPPRSTGAGEDRALGAPDTRLRGQMDTGGARSLNRSSPSCVTGPTQRTDFFHGLLAKDSDAAAREPPETAPWSGGLSAVPPQHATRPRPEPLLRDGRPGSVTSRTQGLVTCKGAAIAISRSLSATRACSSGDLQPSMPAWEGPKRRLSRRAMCSVQFALLPASLTACTLSSRRRPVAPSDSRSLIACRN